MLLKEKKEFFQIESIEDIKDNVNPNILVLEKIEEGSKNMTKDVKNSKEYIIETVSELSSVRSVLRTFEDRFFDKKLIDSVPKKYQDKYDAIILETKDKLAKLTEEMLKDVFSEDNG